MLVADIIGVMGGYVVSVHKLGFNADAPIIMPTPSTFLEVMDVASGLVKAAVFGFLIALMGCYHGYHSRTAAPRVLGQATTNAVVSGAILILTFELHRHRGVLLAMSEPRAPGPDSKLHWCGG